MPDAAPSLIAEARRIHAELVEPALGVPLQDCARAIAATHVVSFSHQGDMAAWFDAASGRPDPERWLFSDSLAEPRAHGRFSQVLARDLEGLARCLRASTR